jgi:DNA-binding NarL/FixJ family response regulator
MQDRSSPKQPPIRILLVENHQFMRDGMRLSLQQESDMRVVGEAADGATALRLSKDLCPDVVVTEIGLPDGDGLEFSHDILRQRRDTHIVIHTARADREHLDLALTAGIRAFVLKGEAASELKTAIRRAARCETFLSQEVAALLVESYQELRAKGPPNHDLLLSDRETTILKSMADGRNTKEIAEQLSCSIKTVDYHRKRIMAKARVHSVAELTKYALRKGLTSP